MSGAPRILSVAFLIFTLGLGAPSARGQTDREPPPKEPFARSVTQFVEAIGGTYGDEGALVRSSLEGMRQALARWDAFVSAYEAAVAEELRAAPPPRAAGLHRALGIVYLDRARLEDAARELAAAAERDPVQADVWFLLGLIHGHRNEPAAAAEALGRSARLDPDKPTTFYRWAWQLRTLGDPEQAARARRTFIDMRRARLAGPPPAVPPGAPFFDWRLFRDSVGADSVFPPARYAEGFARLAEGGYGQALTRLEAAAATDPLVRLGDRSGANALVADRVARGVAAFRQRDVATAETHLRAAVEMAPAHAEARRILGTIHWASGRRPDGLAQFAEAVRLDRENERARMAIADLLVADGRYADAEQALQEAIAAIPDSGQAYYRLGQVRTTLKKPEEALRALEAAAGRPLVAGFDALHGAIAALQDSLDRDLKRVLARHTLRVERNPNNAEAHVELGSAYLDLGRDDEAIVEFLAALMIDPRHQNAYAALGQAFLRMGEHADAEAATRRAVTLDPMHAGARYALATALIRLGRDREGKQEFDRYQQMLADAHAGRRRDFEVGVLMRQVRASLDRGAYDEAAVHLREAVRLEPDDATLWANLGLALRNAGRLADAAEPFERALALDAGQVVAHRHLAEIYAALGRPGEAQRHRELFERRQPSAPGR